MRKKGKCDLCYWLSTKIAGFECNNPLYRGQNKSVDIYDKIPAGCPLANHSDFFTDGELERMLDRIVATSKIRLNGRDWRLVCFLTNQLAKGAKITTRRRKHVKTLYSRVTKAENATRKRNRQKTEK